MKKFKENYEIVTLPSGVRVVVAPLKERLSVSVGIWVRVGGRDEDPRINGISHFLEHLVFKGTKNRTANQIKEAVEGIGGSLNAFTSEEYTCFLAKVSSRHFESVFQVLADMVIEPVLKEADIRKERTVIMEEIKMTQDQPAELAEELLSELLWPNHALGRPLAGTIESVGAMTRQDIKSYKEHFYDPSLITVAVAGDINVERVLKATQRKFSGLKPREHKDRPLFSGRQFKPSLKIFSKKTEQTHISMGIRGLHKDHPDEYALGLLSVILGGNMSSRLFNEVREKRGLAYEIGSFVRKYHETGAFIVSGGVDNKKAHEAVEVIWQVMTRMAERSTGREELRRAKDFYLGQMDLGLESTMTTMLWIGEDAVCLGRCRTREEVRSAIEKVTPEELKRVSREFIRGAGLNLSIVGPNADRLEKYFKGLHYFLA